MCRRYAKMVLLCILYFVAALVILHFIRPDHNPIRQTTSQYAVGRYGLIMTSAFLGLVLASLGLTSGLQRALSQDAKRKRGLVLIRLWMVGLLIVMIFPINLDDTPMTTSGLIHRIAGPAAFLSLCTGALLISRSFKHDERWYPVYHSAFALSGFMTILFISTLVNIATGAGYAGLSQRILLIIVIAWFVLLATRLLAPPKAGGNTPN